MNSNRRSKIPVQPWKSLVRSERGQAMAMYAFISSLILIGLTVTGFKILPELLNAIDDYAETIYFGINMPIP